MTSSESNGIHIEIIQTHRKPFPDRVVYPIPKNQLGDYTLIQLRVRILKKTPNNLYLNRLQPFIPQLLTSDKQIIQGDLVTEKVFSDIQPSILIEGNQREQFQWWKISPEISTSFSITAKLFWKNNSLQLKIPAIPDNIISSKVTDYFWCFDAFKAKNYQFRFILNTDIETTSVSESNIREEITTPCTNSDILATPWLNFRLVQALSTDNNAIEVDGVTFKIQMPESTFKITKAETKVKLGLHIKNNTSTTLRFCQTSCVEIVLIGEDGKQINPHTDPPIILEPFQYYSVKPGKNAFLNLDAKLLWGYEQDLDTKLKTTWYLDKNLALKRRSDDDKRGFSICPKVQIKLAVPNKTRNRFSGGNGYDCFPDLKIGESYKLQVIYKVAHSSASNIEEQSLEKVWTGWIAMPFIEFRLVKS